LTGAKTGAVRSCSRHPGISKLSHAESDEQLNQVGAGSLAAICVSHLCQPFVRINKHN